MHQDPLLDRLLSRNKENIKARHYWTFVRGIHRWLDLRVTKPSQSAATYKLQSRLKYTWNDRRCFHFVFNNTNLMIYDTNIAPYSEVITKLSWSVESPTHRLLFQQLVWAIMCWLWISLSTLDDSGPLYTQQYLPCTRLHLVDVRCYAAKTTTLICNLGTFRVVAWPLEWFPYSLPVSDHTTPILEQGMLIHVVVIIDFMAKKLLYEHQFTPNEYKPTSKSNIVFKVLGLAVHPLDVLFIVWLWPISTRSFAYHFAKKTGQRNHVCTITFLPMVGSFHTWYIYMYSPLRERVPCI